MTFRDNLMLKLFGGKYLEFYYIDTSLEAFADGLPRTNLPVATGDIMWIDSRANQYLIENNLLTPYGNGYIITANGRMFLGKGGCRGEFLHHKLSRLGFILSLFSSVLAIVAMVIALGK